MIWDASDANPMHRRIPAEVVSRRARAPPRKPAPQEREREAEEVTVELKAAITLKPEARPRWLTKACKMVQEGRASSTELYNIIVSRKFASGLPERVGRKLVSIVEDSMDLFSDKQQRYLSSSDCPLMAHLRARADAALENAEAEEAAADADREQDAADAALALMGDPVAKAGALEAAQRRAKEENERRMAEEGAAKWQAAQDEAALRRQVADAKALARREAARREEKKRQQDAEEESARRQAAEEEAARRRKLEEEADDIFAKALVPQHQPPQRGAGDLRGRSRSISAQPRSGGSRSISSRTARRRARSRRKNRRPDWQTAMAAGGVLTGSRALLMNRDYVEDLPHLPRPTAAGPPVAPQRFASRSRSRHRFRR
mmetsp:Transcript_139973/g.390212  ORF Transcript_139973/g.390212 Transcript_139973/m.390212 type:complete len:375 (+) Transcript_139973:116-1240(+)